MKLKLPAIVGLALLSDIATPAPAGPLDTLVTRARNNLRYSHLAVRIIVTNRQGKVIKKEEAGDLKDLMLTGSLPLYKLKPGVSTLAIIHDDIRQLLDLAAQPSARKGSRPVPSSRPVPGRPTPTSAASKALLRQLAHHTIDPQLEITPIIANHANLAKTSTLTSLKPDWQQGDNQVMSSWMGWSAYDNSFHLAGITRLLTKDGRTIDIAYFCAMPYSTSEDKAPYVRERFLSKIQRIFIEALGRRIIELLDE